MLKELESKLKNVNCSLFMVEQVDNDLYFIGTHGDYCEYQDDVEDDIKISEARHIKNYNDCLVYILDLELKLKDHQILTVIYKDCSERTFFVKNDEEIANIVANGYVDFYCLGDNDEETY